LKNTSGVWPFLQEWSIYEYLNTRFSESVLRIRQVVRSGQIVGKEKWVSVTTLEQIRDSQFPDVKSIKIQGETTTRPAEVKFVTSEFAYHRTDPAKYRDFAASRGFILVLAHDHLPRGLVGADVDVYELEKPDFETWCRANFARLFSRQIGSRAQAKIWIMYQGPNFNKGSPSVKPARLSHRWCPTENLSGFDLAPGDRILFVRTSGASTQLVQKAYMNGEVLVGWTLDEILVAGVSSRIYSRNEYCQRKKLSNDTQFWRQDPKQSAGQWRWDRVFEFRPIAALNQRIPMETLNGRGRPTEFVEAVTQSFCWQKSRELDPATYTRTLERLLATLP